MNHCSYPYLETLSRFGFSAPTPIQQTIHGDVAEGKSLFAKAPTGTGKTLAFLIPLGDRVLANQPGGTQVLVLSPTRELGAQTAKVVRQWLNLMPSEVEALTVGVFLGGDSSRTHLHEGAPCGTFVIATPGRAQDLILRGLLNLDHLQTLVLDEADKLLELGFESQLRVIYEAIPPKTQLVLVSATSSSPSQKRDTWPRWAQKLPVVEVEGPSLDSNESELFSEETTLKSHVKHGMIPVDSHEDKVKALARFFNHPQNTLPGTGEPLKTIVFCQTRENAHNVTESLRKQQISAAVLTGEMGPVERTSVLRRFKSGGLPILVSTNLAARGVDVPDLPMVVHFDLASRPEEYIHRSGRTGRAGKSGSVWSLVTNKQKNFFHNLLLESGLTVESMEVFSEHVPHSHEKIPLPQGPSKSADGFTKIHLNKGKSSKIRPGDIVAALTKDLNFSFQEIGNIYIFDHFSFVELHPQKAASFSHKPKGMRIKTHMVQASLPREE